MLNKSYWKSTNDYTSTGLLLPTTKNVYNNTSIIAGEPIDKTIATSWYRDTLSTITLSTSNTSKHNLFEYNIFTVFSNMTGNGTVHYDYSGAGLRYSGANWDVARFICGIDTNIVNVYIPVILFNSTGNTTISAIEFITNFDNYKDYDYAIVAPPISQSGSQDMQIHFIIESVDFDNNKAGGILQFTTPNISNPVSSHQWSSPTMLRFNGYISNTSVNRYTQITDTFLKSDAYPYKYILPYASTEIDDNKDINSYEQLSSSFENYHVIEKYSNTIRGCWSPVVIYNLLKHVGIPIRDTVNITSETKIYIPLVNEYGYHSGDWVLSTDKKAAESSLYKIKTDTNTIDDTKIPPKPDEDDVEKMNIGGFYTAGGLVQYYSIVNTPQSTPLNELSENLSNWDYVETGKDIMRNLISLKAIPISRELLCRGVSKEITIAGTQTGVTAQTVDSTFDIINLGTVSIPHRYNDFRDYAPYTKIEICAPFVGWLAIPSHCMGHSITVKMTYDIITGNCKVFCILDDNTIVAESCGTISMDIPFTADNVGMKAANMISSLTGVASSALSLGTGIVSGNTMGAASGIIGLANSVTQAVCANNANYTEVKGSTGDGNNFSGVKQCFLKITYPISHLSDNFAHETGYLYNKTAVLTSGIGYTKTSNTYINGPMTETEKNEIITLMESGVIL